AAPPDVAGAGPVPIPVPRPRAPPGAVMQTQRASRNGERMLQRRPAHGGALLRARGDGQSVRRRASDLGWFSIGLGLTQILSPGLLGRAIGIADDSRPRLTMRLCGMREIAAGVGLLSRRNDAVFLWARVAGDVLDLALLGNAMLSPENDRGRLATATASVVGV